MYLETREKIFVGTIIALSIALGLIIINAYIAPLPLLSSLLESCVTLREEVLDWISKYHLLESNLSALQDRYASLLVSYHNLSEVLRALEQENRMLAEKIARLEHLAENVTGLANLTYPIAFDPNAELVYYNNNKTAVLWVRLCVHPEYFRIATQETYRWHELNLAKLKVNKTDSINVGILAMTVYSSYLNGSFLSFLNEMPGTSLYIRASGCYKVPVIIYDAELKGEIVNLTAWRSIALNYNWYYIEYWYAPPGPEWKLINGSVNIIRPFALRINETYKVTFAVIICPAHVHGRVRAGELHVGIPLYVKVRVAE